LRQVNISALMASSKNTRLAANLVRGGARRSYFYLVLPVLLLAMALMVLATVLRPAAGGYGARQGT